MFTLILTVFKQVAQYIQSYRTDEFSKKRNKLLQTVCSFF